MTTERDVSVRESDDEWHRGEWMQTFMGVAYYATDPRAAEVNLDDIAHSLALQCRYNGHTDRFYSVAEHCVLVSYHVSPNDAVYGLLHDAAEAYVGDMIRPLKRQIPVFSDIEEQNLQVIFQRFGHPYPRGGGFPESVHEVDNRILLDEREQLLTHAPPPMPWGIEGLEPLGVKIEGWSPERAEAEYLRRAEQLGLK